MRWRPLSQFDRRAIGKIDRLRIAARRGFSVPPTVWARWSFPPTDQVLAAMPRPFPPPCIVRSAAADEDGLTGSAAGRYDSVVVREAAEFPAALHGVLASMGGAGTVFVQPLMEAERAGVVFFDGFHYERTEALGGNQAITAGTERGEVLRADLQPGDAFSEWLRGLGKVFGREMRAAGALDAEYGRQDSLQDGRPVLLQVRPAAFPVRRNPVLSLANHREILGEHPSPWIVDALVRAGAASVDEFARVDPEVGRWDGRYAEAHAGRAWLNFSFFFRLMDHWGLPRSMVTDGVGGAQQGPGDRRADLPRMLWCTPRLLHLQARNLRTMLGIRRSLERYDRVLDGCRSLSDCFEATVSGLDLALRTNFAINGALSGIAGMRARLGLRGRARVVTEEMMEEYDGVRTQPAARREEGLDRWLDRFGHRGPLESDPMQPRFAELREALLQDVRNAPEPAAVPLRGAGSRRARGPLYAVDRLRERFRDDLMRRWQRLRVRILECAREATSRGELDRFEDAFLLGEKALDPPAGWSATVEQVVRRREGEAALSLPSTARRDEILEAAARGAGQAGAERGTGAGAPPCLRGIGLGQQRFRGRVLRARELPALLAEVAGGRSRLGPDTVLVVPALEPSWAVVFSRVGAVVTEIGGELSHASILLREAGKPALVNCAGVWSTVKDGEDVELDEQAGTLVRQTKPPPPAIET